MKEEERIIRRIRRRKINTEEDEDRILRIRQKKNNDE